MHSALRQLTIPHPDGARPFPALVQYPTTVAPAGTTIGPYPFDATPDAPPAPGRWPVCLISHGGGGSHLIYRSIGTWLAEHGFIVVCPEHPGDNRNDRSASNTDQAAIDRPRHASLAIDAVLRDPLLGPVADSARIAAIGHSMGGYTALVMAGGWPWARPGQRLPMAPDARVRAAVLLAPAADWFLGPEALSSVSVPLLVFAAERDPVTPAARIRQALAGLPAETPVTFEVIPNAGHFSFITPFPAHMRRDDFPPSVDPPGFDREAFHRELPRRIQEFLAGALGTSRRADDGQADAE